MRSIALLVYLSVPLCLCVLCGHPSHCQPGVSCWLGLECERTLLASLALFAIVTISRYRRGLCHGIAIKKKVHDSSPKLAADAALATILPAM